MGSRSFWKIPEARGREPEMARVLGLGGAALPLPFLSLARLAAFRFFFSVFLFLSLFFLYIMDFLICVWQFGLAHPTHIEVRQWIYIEQSLSSAQYLCLLNFGRASLTIRYHKHRICSN